jgi:Ca2+-binding EF-hand superfamily protein
MQRFREADKNNDGVLVAEEVVNFPWIKKSFTTMDTNGDGRVTLGEYFRVARAFGAAHREDRDPP